MAVQVKVDCYIEERDETGVVKSFELLLNTTFKIDYPFITTTGGLRRMVLDRLKEQSGLSDLEMEELSYLKYKNAMYKDEIHDDDKTLHSIGIMHNDTAMSLTICRFSCALTVRDEKGTNHYIRFTRGESPNKLEARIAIRLQKNINDIEVYHKGQKVNSLTETKFLDKETLIVREVIRNPIVQESSKPKQESFKPKENFLKTAGTFALYGLCTSFVLCKSLVYFTHKALANSNISTTLKDMSPKIHLLATVVGAFIGLVGHYNSQITNSHGKQ